MANTTKMEEIKHITKGNITRFIDSERLEVLQRELADIPMKIARATVVGTKKKSKYGPYDTKEDWLAYKFAKKHTKWIQCEKLNDELLAELIHQKKMPTKQNQLIN